MNTAVIFVNCKTDYGIIVWKGWSLIKKTKIAYPNGKLVILMVVSLQIKSC